jgi:hypothetical protein
MSKSVNLFKIKRGINRCDLIEGNTYLFKRSPLKFPADEPIRGMDDEFGGLLNTFHDLVKTHIFSLESNSVPVTANLEAITSFPPLPSLGIGTTKTFEHLQSAILLKLARGHAGPRYYGATQFLSN